MTLLLYHVPLGRHVYGFSIDMEAHILNSSLAPCKHVRPHGQVVRVFANLSESWKHIWNFRKIESMRWWPRCAFPRCNPSSKDLDYLEVDRYIHPLCCLVHVGRIWGYLKQFIFWSLIKRKPPKMPYRTAYLPVQWCSHARHQYDFINIVCANVQWYPTVGRHSVGLLWMRTSQ